MADTRLGSAAVTNLRSSVQMHHPNQHKKIQDYDLLTSIAAS
jgi:hypothetical protein